MIIKNLKIINTKRQEIIRNLNFSKYTNFIVDRTTDAQKETGNNVGKTTVLKLIDVCLGADPSIIYKNRESKSSDFNDSVKSFLEDEKVEVELTLGNENEDIVITRNFLSRKETVRKINGENYTKENFENKLKELLFNKITSRKPSIRQLMPRILRYTDYALQDPLKYLPSTNDLDYEIIYLNMFGLYTENIDKEDLRKRIQSEEVFIKKISNGLTKVELMFSIREFEKEINKLKEFNSKFNISENYNFDIKEMNNIKTKINNIKNKISLINSKIDFQEISLNEIRNAIANINIKNLEAEYKEIKTYVDNISKTFEQLVEFHNLMTNQKEKILVDVINKNRGEVDSANKELENLLLLENEYALKLEKKEWFNHYESNSREIESLTINKAKYDEIVEQIQNAEKKIELIRNQIISSKRVNEDDLINRLEIFNSHFTEILDIFYGQSTSLIFDKKRTKNNIDYYKFYYFSSGQSTGKLQGDIICFDIAYILFAKELKLDYLNFICSDKKELLHDNQLKKAVEVTKTNDIQLIIPILESKLPKELDLEQNILLELSQENKLFKI